MGDMICLTRAYNGVFHLLFALLLRRAFEIYVVFFQNIADNLPVAEMPHGGQMEALHCLLKDPSQYRARESSNVFFFRALSYYFDILLSSIQASEFP